MQRTHAWYNCVGSEQQLEEQLAAARKDAVTQRARAEELARRNASLEQVARRESTVLEKVKVLCDQLCSRPLNTVAPHVMMGLLLIHRCSTQTPRGGSASVKGCRCKCES